MINLKSGRGHTGFFCISDVKLLVDVFRKKIKEAKKFNIHPVFLVSLSCYTTESVL